MGRHWRIAFALLGLGLGVAAAAPPAPARAAAQSDLPCGLTTTGRIVAVGDIHGAYDRWTGILQAAELIDDDHDWTGGDAIYVQLGDAIDRGPDTRRVLDRLRDLEREAERAGGRVIYLLGNHEVMRMQADLRYVDEAEYESFRSPSSQSLRDRTWELVLQRRRDAARAAGEPFDERAERSQFFDATPLGLVEMQQAFGADGEYGRWLRQHDVIAEINDVVFVHGGISATTAGLGCTGIASAARDELRSDRITDPRRHDLLLDREDGPLWDRGLIEGPVSPTDMDRILDALGADRIVVGHTASDDGRVATRFDGRLIAIDTGMLGGTWYPGGVASALEIDGSTLTAIYADRREVLVSGSDRARR